MLSLDPMTVERVAKLVCDPGGPYERSGRDLEKLLGRSAWADPPAYDGSPRVPWLAEALEGRTGDQAAVERFLGRVCDPLEYLDGMTTAGEICQALNHVLEPERLAVSYVSGRPVLGELRNDSATASFGVPSDLDARLRRLIDDGNAVDQLLARINETRILRKQRCVCARNHWDRQLRRRTALLCTYRARSAVPNEGPRLKEWQVAPSRSSLAGAASLDGPR